MKKEIKLISSDELIKALDLAWDVFCETAAHDCTKEGIEEFWKSVDHEYMIFRAGDGACRVYGAFADDELIGMCVIRDTSFIEMVFVVPEAQKKGVGSALIKKAVMDAKKADELVTRVTVNSFRSAYGFFEKLGFTPVCAEETADGITYTTMAAEAKS